MSKLTARLVFLLAIIFLSACSTRHLQDSLGGSTAQRLVTHSIDDLIGKLPDEQFEPLRNETLYLDTHFVNNEDVKKYADERLAIELRNRFGIHITTEQQPDLKSLSVFYTSLATDRDTFGITLPLGFVPGFDSYAHLNIISLEKFHGISEMFYYIGEVGDQSRSKTLQAVVKTDALGLPFITIPITNLDRSD